MRKARIVRQFDILALSKAHSLLRDVVGESLIAVDVSALASRSGLKNVQIDASSSLVFLERAPMIVPGSSACPR